MWMPKGFDGDAWDICRDFLEPLARMLEDWGYKRIEADGRAAWPAGVPCPYAAPPEKAEGEQDCILPFLNVAHDHAIPLVETWLQVNVSMELAEQVTKLIADTRDSVLAEEIAGRWPNTLKAAWYFKSLARVLRQREGKPISKAELAAERKQEADDFRGPFTVAELTNGKRKGGAYRKGLLGITRSTLYARKKKEPGMFREGIGGLFVHKSLLPNR